VSAPWPQDLLPELARRAAARPAVVLDDDPTGTQTLSDVFVLTRWDVESIGRHLADPLVFLSTNSRSLDAEAALEITRDAASSARRAAAAASRPISLVSRSDSTLRGHFPGEAVAIAEAGGVPDARLLLAPYFGDGGRVTVGDVHSLERDGTRIPVGETEFARDTAFGYHSSNLRDWVAEKYDAAGLGPPPLESVSLELIRGGGPDGVRDLLRSLPAGGVAIANAEVDRDIEVVALGAMLAEEHGLPLVARTAASYVRARAGRPRSAPLGRDEIGGRGPGVIVVGSHVETTTRQLRHLLSGSTRIDATELTVTALLDDSAPVAEAAAALDAALAAGRIGLVSTERTPHEVGLEDGRRISSALVEVVRRVLGRPAWMIAKGGITSYDVAARGLDMAEARVAGQLLPGVPVWVGTSGSRWPGMPLVVFPGNVGDDAALLRAVDALDAP
jgi:uncharacterized protein YgbK (DUF1537 family)